MSPKRIIIGSKIYGLGNANPSSDRKSDDIEYVEKAIPTY